MDANHGRKTMAGWRGRRGASAMVSDKNSFDEVSITLNIMCQIINLIGNLLKGRFASYLNYKR